MSRTLISFTNATLRRDCIMGIVTIPGAYPGHPPRTRVITPGSFPVDVAESHEEALRRWRGTEADEAIRVKDQQNALLKVTTQLNNVRNVLMGATSTTSLEDLQRIIAALRVQVEAE